MQWVDWTAQIFERNAIKGVFLIIFQNGSFSNIH